MLLRYKAKAKKIRERRTLWQRDGPLFTEVWTLSDPGLKNSNSYLALTARTKSRYSADDIIDRRREVLDIATCHPCHGNAAVGKHVDMMLINHRSGLVLRKARERKHTDLRRDVGPTSWRAERCELVKERFPHILNANGHGAELVFPLLIKLLVAENRFHDLGPVLGRIRIEVADDNVKLRHNISNDLCAATGHGECANALAIQAKVFREGLRQEDWHTAVSKFALCIRVYFQIASRKALIRTVKPADVFLLLTHGQDLIPLLLGGVDARRVVCGGMQQHNGASWRLLNIRKHA